jgi:hypothetical protein
MNRPPTVAALLLLLAACGPEPHEATLPLRMRIAAPDTLRPGETLRMTAWLLNPTGRPLRMEFDDQCQVEMYVQGPDMTILHPPGGGASCVGAPSALEIAPRDSLRFEGTWMATSSVLGDHIAYAVLWPYHVPHEGGRADREGHRSNVVVFPVRVPE